MKPSNPPTIRTIAEHVDLSPATVSLALRGDESIPVHTRKRVLAAAKELNYQFTGRRKKAEAKAIRQFVYVVKDYGDQVVSANPFYGQILRGVEQKCQQAHAKLSYVTLEHALANNAELPATLINEVDGIIMAGPYQPALLDRIAHESGSSIVLIDNYFPGIEYDTVMADDYGGSYLMTRYLIEQGHQQILMVAGQPPLLDLPPSFRERYIGYSDACYATGLEPLPLGRIPPIEYPSERYQELHKAWLIETLHTYPNLTAFYGAGDSYAIALLQALQGLGYVVPEQFSVVGFDDYELSSFVTPALTTIRSHKQKIGQLAVERLVKRIEGDDSPNMRINLSVNLVKRASVAVRTP
jgi:LacI family transcriptional regulator